MDRLVDPSCTEDMTSHQYPDHLTLITGGTGKTGRRIAERLAARGRPVRIGSRSGTPPFDWDDQASWAAALEGVHATYLSYYPDLAVTGAASTVAAFAAAAVDAGVRRLVLLSGRGEREAQRAERAVQSAGAEWTILQCSWFSQNFSESYLLNPILDGEVTLPAGSVVEPFVDADDIADVAATALTQEGHVGREYELTGPRLLSFADAVGEIARATGRSISYLPVSAQEYSTALAAQGVPDSVIDLLGYLFTEVLDGRNAHVTDGVFRALGRGPRDFRDYARTVAASGAWQPLPTVPTVPAGTSR
jgi:uncharacterized protein YbjT (DUF2867 family)